MLNYECKSTFGVQKIIYKRILNTEVGKSNLKSLTERFLFASNKDIELAF